MTHQTPSKTGNTDTNTNNQKLAGAMAAHAATLRTIAKLLLSASEHEAFFEEPAAKPSTVSELITDLGNIEGGLLVMMEVLADLDTDQDPALAVGLDLLETQQTRMSSIRASLSDIEAGASRFPLPDLIEAGEKITLAAGSVSSIADILEAHNGKLLRQVA